MSVVTPIIGFIDNIDLQAMAPSHEVESIFTIPINALLDPEKQEMKSVELNKGKSNPVQLRVYTAGQWPVWGLTSYITEQILKELDKIQC